MNPKALILLGLAPLLALIAGLILAFAPVWEDGESLTEALGPGALLIVAAAVFAMAVPLRFPPSTQAAAATGIAVGVVVASFFTPLAIWFLPAAAALLGASLLAPGES